PPGLSPAAPVPAAPAPAAPAAPPAETVAEPPPQPAPIAVPVPPRRPDAPPPVVAVPEETRPEAVATDPAEAPATGLEPLPGIPPEAAAAVPTLTAPTDALPAVAPAGDAAPSAEVPAGPRSDDPIGDAVAAAEASTALAPPGIDLAYGACQRGFYLTAFSHAIERAGKGDAAAQTLLALMYEGGYGVPQNLKEAANWYGLAAKAGDREAQYAMGLMLLAGRGV